MDNFDLKKYLVENRSTKSDQLNELINEGQISITELNPTDQKQIKQLENILDGKLDTIYSGGGQDGRFVASIKLSNNYSIYEFTPVVMKNILKFNIKYVTGGYGLVNIAFN
jgi:ubiquitin-protein ligase